MTYMQDVVFWIDERANTAIHGMAERMSVHTGVKWQLQRTPYESEIDIVSDGRVIATVEAGEGKEKVAQMMAAAPDMLEALESVLSLIDESSGVAGYHLNGEVASWGELDIREELEATIRKARGEE